MSFVSMRFLPVVTKAISHGADTAPVASQNDWGIRASSAQAPFENRLLRMKAVLRLIEDNALWTVDDIVGHFLAAMRREALHEDRVLFGARHQARIHLVGFQKV